MKTIVIGGESNGLILYVDGHYQAPDTINLPLKGSMTSVSDNEKGPEWRKKFNWYRLMPIGIYLDEHLTEDDLISILTQRNNLLMERK